MNGSVSIRTAAEEDAAPLTRLARESKASWGYPEEWLREWEPELLISEDYIRLNSVFVAESDGRLVGVVGVGIGPDGPEIGHLWITADGQGKGLGRTLVDLAKNVAREREWKDLRIISDPYAQPFYERMGAVQIGVVAAPVAGTSRSLPVLCLETCVSGFEDRVTDD